jgi:hypothetical protein
MLSLPPLGPCWSGATGVHPDGIWLGLLERPHRGRRVPVEPAMPSFYLTVTMLLLISLGLLEFASTFSDSDFVVAPTMSNTISGFDGMR